MACCCGATVPCNDCCGYDCGGTPALQGKKCSQIFFRIRMDVGSLSGVSVVVPYTGNSTYPSGMGNFSIDVPGFSKTFYCSGACEIYPTGSFGGAFYAGRMSAGVGDCSENGGGFWADIEGYFRILIVGNSCRFRVEANHSVTRARFISVNRIQPSGSWDPPYYGFLRVFEPPWKLPGVYAPIAEQWQTATVAEKNALCAADLIGTSLAQDLFNNSSSTRFEVGQCRGGIPYDAEVAAPPNTSVTWTIEDVTQTALP